MNLTVFFSKRPWVCAKDQSAYLARSDFSNKRITVTRKDDLIDWMLDQGGLKLATNGPENYHVVIGSPGSWSYYDFPKFKSAEAGGLRFADAMSLTDAVWNVVDFHEAFYIEIT